MGHASQFLLPIDDRCETTETFIYLYLDHEDELIILMPSSTYDRPLLYCIRFEFIANNRDSSIMSTVPSSSNKKKSNNSTLSIRLHAVNLPRQGRLRKRSPNTYAVVTSLISSTQNKSNMPPEIISSTLRPSSISQGRIWGRTETIYQSCHPQWIECIPVPSLPVDENNTNGEQYFYVHIFQEEKNKGATKAAAKATTNSISTSISNSWDGYSLASTTTTCTNNKTLDFSKSLGSAVFEVTNVLQSSPHARIKRLRNGGCIVCRMDSYHSGFGVRKQEQHSINNNNNNSNHTTGSSTLRLQWQFQISNLVLPQRRQWSQRIPLQVYVEWAKRPGGHKQSMWVTTHRSNVVFSQKDSIVWEEDAMDLGSLCNGDETQPILLTVKVVLSGRQTMVIGVTETTLQNLLFLGEQARASRPEHARSGREKRALSYDDNPFQQDENDENDEEQDDGSSSQKSHNSTGSSSDEEGGGAGADAPLLPNELFLQRSFMKLKRVGRLRVLNAELVSMAFASVEGSVYDQEYSPPVETIDISRLQSTREPQNGPRLMDASNFPEYVKRGLRLEFCVGVDFTSSNGNPLLEGTNHYQDPNGALNDYEETIVAVGSAIDLYSNSKEYSVFGFGAKYGGLVRHLFQVGPSPQVQGVDGILEAYRSVFSSDLIMSGPTILTEVMQKAAIQAKSYQADESSNTLRYVVLLIITDGLADSFEETQRKLAVYSQVPLSIVIVGVGESCNYDKMYQLVDSASQHQQGSRRNVSFVEFRRHQNSPEALGTAALQDVPLQVCEYLAMRGVM